METKEYDSFTIDNVTKEEMEKFREFFKANRGRGYEGTSGTAISSCFESKYAYDPNSEQLHMAPIKLIEKLTGRHLKRVMEHVIRPSVENEMTIATGETIYKPTPNGCAKYNWAVGFITNNSGGTLTYTSNDTKHGDFTSEVNSIPDGNVPRDQAKTGVWQTAGTKDSALGCFGSVVYTLADGVTTMTISYGVNTSSALSASVGLGGTNVARYTATMTRYSQFSGANTCEYLYPYVELKKSN